MSRHGTGHHTEPVGCQRAEEEGETTQHVNVTLAHILPFAFQCQYMLSYIKQCAVKVNKQVLIQQKYSLYSYPKYLLIVCEVC